MAKLHRMVQLNDRFDTRVFTFLLPPAVATVTSQDIFSKEFIYGHHRWTLSTIRGDQHLGAYLAMTNVYDGMTCSVDFTVTLLNHDHYTKNETYVERGCVFSSQNQRHGRKSFIALTDLTSRGFQLQQLGGGGEAGAGWFLLELEIRNCRSSFEQLVEPSRDTKVHGGHRYPRYETSCFSFGNFDWTVVVYPNGDGDQAAAAADRRLVFYLFRQTSFDHTSRIRYQVTVERADHLLVRTNVLESLVDASGQCDAHVLSDDQSPRTAPIGVKGQLKIRLDLLSCTTITEVQLCPFNRGKNTAYLYDRDQQAWMLESDITGDRLRFRLYYGDIRNIPRGHLRFVGWRVHVLPISGLSEKECEEKKTKDKNMTTYYHYYIQTDVDEGFTMTTDISTAQLNGNGVYLGGDGDRMTVQVEWVESQLLFHEKWQLIDNVVVQHKHQMWRELQALQAENYALEKQVHSYQLSIARNSAKWSMPDEEQTTNHCTNPIETNE